MKKDKCFEEDNTKKYRKEIASNLKYEDAALIELKEQLK